MVSVRPTGADCTIAATAWSVHAADSAQTVNVRSALPNFDAVLDPVTRMEHDLVAFRKSLENFPF